MMTLKNNIGKKKVMFLSALVFIIAVMILAPSAVNYFLLKPSTHPVVGTNVDWLAFWGSYLAALVSVLIAFLILFIQRRDNHNENKQSRVLQLNVLKYQQEMQWLNENRGILIDFVLTLNKDNLIELANKMGAGQDILHDVKYLLSELVKNDSRAGFMRVSVETDKYKEYNAQRSSAFYQYRDALLDLQEISYLFIRTNTANRSVVLNSHLQKGLIHKGLMDVIATYPNHTVFLSQHPHDLAVKLIFGMPDLLEDTRKMALEYVKSEENRISTLLTAM